MRACSLRLRWRSHGSVFAAPFYGLFLFLDLSFLGIIGGAVFVIILAGRDPPVRGAASAIAARGSAWTVPPDGGDW